MTNTIDVQTPNLISKGDVRAFDFSSSLLTLLINEDLFFLRRKRLKREKRKKVK